MYIVELSWGCVFLGCFLHVKTAYYKSCRVFFYMFIFPKPTTPVFFRGFVQPNSQPKCLFPEKRLDVPHGSSSRIVAVDPLGTKVDKAPKDHYLHQRFGIPREPHTSGTSRDAHAHTLPIPFPVLQGRFWWGSGMGVVLSGIFLGGEITGSKINIETQKKLILWKETGFSFFWSGHFLGSMLVFLVDYPPEKGFENLSHQNPGKVRKKSSTRLNLDPPPSAPSVGGNGFNW